jgi:hypothetical protein
MMPYILVYVYLLTKLLIMQFSPPSRHLVPLRSKYSPQHPVLELFQTIARQFFFIYLPTAIGLMPGGSVYIKLTNTDKMNKTQTTDPIMCSCWEWSLLSSWF